MRILLTGATGFIGKALLERLLIRGDVVTALTRQAPESLPSRPSLRWVRWDPRADGAWQLELEGQDAIVHLAGESVAGRRWNDKVRQEIRDSRVIPTERIVAGLTKVGQKPRVLVSASGIGFYGVNASDEPHDETAAPGRDFLAHVCIEWEDAAREAERYGVRVVMSRTGFVLGKDGGALAKLVPIFRSYAGGRLGDGQQVVPWIHLDDVVGALLHAMGDPTLMGPVNVVAPNEVTNAVFTKSLGEALGRPSLLPVPKFALKLLFGEGAEPILGGQNAVPRALVEHGYPFRYSNLDEALKDILKPATEAERLSSARP